MSVDSLHVASATGVDVALPIAGAGSRSYAFLIDWHIRVLFAGAWFIVAALVVAGSLTKVGAASSGGRVLVILPAILLYVLYHPVLEIAMRGRTPGKRMAGVRLVTRHGGTPSVGAVLIRNVFRLLDTLPAFYMLGLVVTLATRDAVRIGDMAAGTLLVKDDSASLAALDALAGVSRDTVHDPVLIDVAHDLLRRWDELDPARRTTLARSMLTRLGVEVIGPDVHEEALRTQLRTRLAGGDTTR